MDEMTEKQEEATRIIEAIGTTTLNECYVPVMCALPCPFCGSDTEIETTTFGDSMIDYFRVNCRQKGHSLDWWSDTVDEAISVWNERQ